MLRMRTVYGAMFLINFKTCVSLSVAAHVCHGDLLGGTNTVSDEYWANSYKCNIEQQCDMNN